MCTIAGYVGTKPAAPLLIEMMRKEEGIDSGYYTGITTIHQGKIHYRKVIGSLDQLLRETDAAELPGTIGIIHSRTPGAFLDGRWAHPHVCVKDGEVTEALVMNGHGGVFKEKTKISNPPIAEELYAQGYEMRSAVDAETFRGGIELQNGICVHSTDAKTQYAGRLIRQGVDTATAAAEAFCALPSEAVSLMLSLSEPEAITWVRMNFPMFVGFADHGAYLATVPLAWPEDAGEPLVLPALSSGLVRKDGYTVKRFPNPPVTVAPITPKVWHAAYEGIQKAMREGVQKGFGATFKDAFEKADCTQANVVTYAVLSELYRQGRLKMETEYVPAKKEGLLAPKTKYTLLD